MKTSIAQVLVHIDPSPGAALRLEVARTLAQQQGAALTALYAATPAFVDAPFAPGVGPEIAVAMRQLDDTYLARARDVFDDNQKSAQVRATWAEIRDDPVVAVFAQQALYADLLVLGQHYPTEQHGSYVPTDFAQSVMIASGKPTLMVPGIGAPAQIGQTVVIAWKPTREAARAVAAALPLLQGAQAVHVVSWDSLEEPVGGQPLNLSGYLNLHGIQTTWHHQGAETKDMGELLLSRAFDVQADLLVMGCYGHSRAREWVLGGVSRTILSAMTLPVLMSH
jgi:nucleotide-binding universal stress UspA family protein